jgi:acetylornithine deacetylase
VLEVRLAAQPGEDLEAIKARFEAAVDARVEWRGFHAHGFELTRDEPIFAALGRAHEQVHGAPLEFLEFTGTTDARAFVVHDETTATCYGPIGGNLHAPDEWVDLESVKATTLVLAQAAAEWCG